MKHQYVGDINDYRKYALLRALSDSGVNRIGVCWMLTPSDDSSDGNKLDYLRKPERNREYDPELFDLLSHAAAEPHLRRLRTIEDSGAVPNAIYHNEALPQAAEERAAYMAACRTEFRQADLVFFDPDNGIEVTSSHIGRKSALKYVFLEEVATFYEQRKSVLIYQHFPRVVRAAFTDQCQTRLLRVTPGAACWSFVTPAVVFFLLLHPESPARLAIAALEACSRWEPKFIYGEYLGRDTNDRSKLTPNLEHASFPLG